LFLEELRVDHWIGGAGVEGVTGDEVAADELSVDVVDEVAVVVLGDAPLAAGGGGFALPFAVDLAELDGCVGAVKPSYRAWAPGH